MRFFCMANLENFERFLNHSNLSFERLNFIYMETRQLELTKINSSVRKYIFSRNSVKLTQVKLFLMSKVNPF